jgi:8-oxo-dGTP diphosphatase
LDPPAIHVVAAVLRDADGRILLTQRPPGKHLAGLWEFPGGKREYGESAGDALRRELHEEIGIEAGALQRIIGFPWNYPEKSIFLDVYEVADFRGSPHGREGQAMRWEFPDDLLDIPMPAADVPIVSALRLPDRYAITPESSGDEAVFLTTLETVLQRGIKLVQLRSKHSKPDVLSALAAKAHRICRRHRARLLLNGHAELAAHTDVDGVHLPSAELMKCTQRPLDHAFLIGASCHDIDELEHAATIGVDFAVLGPVMPTRSHPIDGALGWARFAELCANLPLPIYALGGMSLHDLPTALNARAQGIAGISTFWNA